MWTLAFAVTMNLPILVQLTLVTGAAPSPTSPVAWAEFALSLAVPVLFSGVVVSLALTRSPYPIGAGCTEPSSIRRGHRVHRSAALLNVMSGPSAVLWVGGLIALAALAFAGSELGAVPKSTSLGFHVFRHPPVEHAAGRLLLAIANTLTTHGVRPTIIKDHLEAAADLAYDRWNSFSRITVSQSQTVPPSMFGASPRMPDSTIEQRALNIDGGAGTALYRFDGNLESSGLPAL